MDGACDLAAFDPILHILQHVHVNRYASDHTSADSGREGLEQSDTNYFLPRHLLGPFGCFIGLLWLF